MAGNVTISDTYDRVFTTTRTHVIPGLFDNITADIPVIYELRQQDAVVLQGGAAIEFNVLKELPAAIGAGATQKINPIFLDPATRGRYIWKSIYVAFKMPGVEMRKNEGEEAIIDFVAMHVEAARAGMVDALGKSTLGVWSSGDETDATVLTGFGNLIKATGNATGTTGTIARSNTWWQNSLTGVTAITSFASNGPSGWRSALFAAKRMNESPNLLITNNTQLQNYLNSLTSTFRMNLPIDARLVETGSWDAGVSQTSFYGMKIVGDSQATANLAYFVNTKYLKLYVKEGADMELSEAMFMTDEDSVVMRLISMLNLGCTSLARQSVVSGGDTA